MITMAEWFGLSKGHSDFSLDNDSDREFLFARAELNDRIMAILRRTFRTGHAPKFVLYGDWGVGKTHTMRHVEYVLTSESDFSANVVFIELPDIGKKSTFQIAHAALLDALGLDTAKTWMTQFQARHGADATREIQELTQSGDIAKAFATLIGFGEASRIAWDWLRGANLSSAEARSVALPSALSQSHALVQVLRFLGRLSKEVDGRPLVFLVDEATKLDNVTDADAIHHWVNAMKVISSDDVREFGFIASASYMDQDDMPLALSDQQVVTRFGESSYILLPTFGEDQARQFVDALLDEIVDDARRKQITVDHDSETEGEACGNTYPFTDAAFEELISYLTRLGGITRPRDIQQTLNDILNRAIDDDRHLLSSAYLARLFAEG